MGKNVEIIQSESTAITPAGMIQQALTSGAGVEVMAGLMALQERWEATQARKAFDNAMAELRLNMPEIIKRQEVDFTTTKGRTNYRYEDLSAVTSALSPVMSACGLSFRWRTESSAGGVAVTCIISHRDGHSEETTLSAGFDNSGNKNAIQALGSAVTYLQRYTLKAAVGVAAAQDDDGQSAGRRPDAPQEAAPLVDARDVYARLSKANRDAGTMADFDRLWRARNVNEAFEGLPKDWRQKLVDERNAKADELSPAPEDDPFGAVDPNAAFDRMQDDFPGERP